jgi:hypothetical protein
MFIRGIFLFFQDTVLFVRCAEKQGASTRPTPKVGRGAPTTVFYYRQGRMVLFPPLFFISLIPLIRIDKCFFTLYQVVINWWGQVNDIGFKSR